MTALSEYCGVLSHRISISLSLSAVLGAIQETCLPFVRVHPSGIGCQPACRLTSLSSQPC